MHPNAPYFVVIGGTPIRIHNAHALLCGNEGLNELMCCCQYSGFLTLPSLNMEMEEHLQNLLVNLASLKARRLRRREDIKQLNCSKHVDETRN